MLYSNRYRNSLNALLGALEDTVPEDRASVLLYPNEASLLQDLPKHGRSLVVSSLMSTDASVRTCFFDHVRTLNPSALLVSGGPHISAGDPLLEQRCHWIVRGEGEEAFSEVVERVRAGENPTKPQTITGRTLELDRYSPFPHRLNVIGPIELMRGCPHGCSFCQTRSLFGSTVRERSPEAVFETVRMMRNHHRSIDLRFIAPNAFAYRSADGVTPNPHAVYDFLHGLRQMIGRKGRIFFGSFPSEVRPDSITPDILNVVRSMTDNHRLVIGAQSGCDRSLARLHRGHSRQDVLIGVERARCAGFETIVDFIFGLPGENDQEVELTVETIERIVQLGARIHAHSFLPLPGTALANQAPRPISPSLKRVLGTLARRGHLFGQWQTQEILARQLTALPSQPHPSMGR